MKADTKIFGCIADPINHVKAPTLFTKIFQEKKLENYTGNSKSDVYHEEFQRKPNKSIEPRKLEAIANTAKPNQKSNSPK